MSPPVSFSHPISCCRSDPKDSSYRAFCSVILAFDKAFGFPQPHLHVSLSLPAYLCTTRVASDLLFITGNGSRPCVVLAPFFPSVCRATPDLTSSSLPASSRPPVGRARVAQARARAPMVTDGRTACADPPQPSACACLFSQAQAHFRVSDARCERARLARA